MDMAGRPHAFHRLNPFVCGQGSLPLQGILVAKLLVIYAVLTKIPGASQSLAPFIPGTEHIPAPDTIRLILKLGIAACSLLIMFNISDRPACLYVGAAALVIILWSRLNFSNNQLFLTLMFLCLGLQVRGDSFWSIRFTIGLLYAGAGLNKLLTADWRQGVFMRFWFGENSPTTWFKVTSELMGPEIPALVLSWTVIVMELALAICFLYKPRLQLGIKAGLLFHFGMLVMTGGELSHRFFFLMASAYLLFIPWPASGIIQINSGKCFHWMRKLDFDRQFLWRKITGSPLGFQTTGFGKYPTGILSFIRILIYLPAVWIGIAAVYGLIIFGWP